MEDMLIHLHFSYLMPSLPATVCLVQLILRLVPIAGLQDITNGALKQRFIVSILQVWMQKAQKTGIMWNQGMDVFEGNGSWHGVGAAWCCLVASNFCSVVSHPFETKFRVGFTPERSWEPNSFATSEVWLSWKMTWSSRLTFWIIFRPGVLSGR